MNKYLTTLHPLLFIFFITGLVIWKRVSKEWLFEVYIITVIAFYILILYKLNITNISSSDDIYHYPSRRHLMPLVIPAIFCVGVGVCATGTWICERFEIYRQKFGFGELFRNVWIVQLIILLLIVCVLLPKTLKPQRADKLGIKKAGQWIKENSDKPLPAILNSSSRNAYYAGGRHVHMWNVNKIFSIARKDNLDYIKIRQKEYAVIEKDLLQAIKDEQIMPVYKHPEKNSLYGNSTFLYKMLY